MAACQHIPSVDLLMDAVFAASRRHPCLPWQSPCPQSIARGFLPKEAGFVHLAHNYVRHDCPGPSLRTPHRWERSDRSTALLAGNRTGCKDPDAPEVARLWRTRAVPEASRWKLTARETPGKFFTRPSRRRGSRCGASVITNTA